MRWIFGANPSETIEHGEEVLRGDLPAENSSKSNNVRPELDFYCLQGEDIISVNRGKRPRVFKLSSESQCYST